MRPWKAVLVLFLFFLAGSAGRIPPVLAEHFVEHRANGRIDWSEQIVSAKGSGSPSADTSQAREHANVKARRNASMNLLETVKSVQLTSSETVRQKVSGQDSILVKLEEILKKAPVEDTSYMSDGTVEIQKKISITGAFAQLMLPEAIVQLEMKKMGHQASVDEAGVYSGLIVDARRIDIRPSLSFRVIDEKGNEVYGPAYVSRENAVQRGMCEYWTEMKDVADSERVGRNPLVVRGLKPVEPGGTDIVISNSDASRLRSAVDHLFLLRKCRVVVIANPLDED